MKITTTKTTVADLRALLADASPTDEVSFVRATKKAEVPCWCGCGGSTKSRFVPGHDSKFHGLAKRVARGEAGIDESIAGLPHDEAIAEFEHHVAVELPKAKARREEKAAKVAAREAEKAAKKAAKAAEAETSNEDDDNAAFFSDLETADEAAVAVAG